MRRGCAIYSFVSADGDVYSREPGARISTTQFGDLQVRSLHDPVVVRLADGRYRMYVAATLLERHGHGRHGDRDRHDPAAADRSAAHAWPAGAGHRRRHRRRQARCTRRGWQELLERARQANPARYQFAIDRGAEIHPTADGRSFYFAWYPEGTTEERRPPIVATLHGSASWAFDEFLLWYPHLIERGYGIVALQWWFGGGDGAADYYQPQEIYRALDVAFDREEVRAGTVMLHGFSRGSANSYGVIALDVASRQSLFRAGRRQRGRRGR